MSAASVRTSGRRDSFPVPQGGRNLDGPLLDKVNDYVGLRREKQSVVQLETEERQQS